MSLSSCPQNTACLYNGVDYHCCPMEREQPYASKASSGYSTPVYGKIDPPPPTFPVNPCSGQQIPSDCKDSTSGCSQSGCGSSTGGYAGNQPLPIYQPSVPTGGCSVLGCGGVSQPYPSAPSTGYGQPVSNPSLYQPVPSKPSAGCASSPSGCQNIPVIASHPKPIPTQTSYPSQTQPIGASSYTPSSGCGSSGCGSSTAGYGQSGGQLPLFLGPINPSSSTGCSSPSGCGTSASACPGPSCGSGQNQGISCSDSECKLIGGDIDGMCKGGILTAAGCSTYSAPSTSGYGSPPQPSSYSGTGSQQKITGHIKPQTLIYPIPNCCPDDSPQNCIFPCSQIQSPYDLIPDTEVQPYQQQSSYSSNNVQPYGVAVISSPVIDAKSNMPWTFNEAHGIVAPIAGKQYPSGTGWGLPKSSPKGPIVPESVSGGTTSPESVIATTAEALDLLTTTAAPVTPVDSTSPSSAVVTPTAPNLKRQSFNRQEKKTDFKKTLIKKISKPVGSKFKDSIGGEMLDFSS